MAMCVAMRLYNIQRKLLTDRKVTLVVTDNLHKQ